MIYACLMFHYKRSFKFLTNGAKCSKLILTWLYSTECEKQVKVNIHCLRLYEV